jgi:lysylphosphatidylglycerol synthetase-like protein (DUF2156 family)
VSRAVPGPENRHAHPGTDSGGAAAGCAEAVSGPARPGGRALAALAGLREPVIWVLLAIAFFTSISGKPVDGVLILIVATGLIWDTGRRALRPGRSAGHGAQAGQGGEDGAGLMPRPAGRHDGRRRLLAGALLACGAASAVLVGSFIRYSWPATAGIVGLGTIVVMAGWHGPRRARPARRLPVAGTLAWAVLLVAGCLWELGALLQQPSLTTDSYAHPTISTLTDPLLATSPGRAVLLLAWLAFGWYLVER